MSRLQVDDLRPTGHTGLGPATLPAPAGQFGWPKLAAVAILLGAALVWAYWPTIGKMVAAWSKQADYSHGFLVPPLAVFVLWVRREQFPGVRLGFAWPGLVLLGASVGLRFLSGLWYMDALDGFSMLLWLAGTVWLLLGGRVLWWTLPAIAFLGFMIPLPFRVERWLSYPLQGIATTISSWALQCLLQPAVREGNTIFLGSHTPLEVAEACSGLRIFVGVFALAYLYVVLVRQSWWERTLLLLCTIPVALVSNATRIVVTGILYQLRSEEAGKKFSHDIAGWGMILFAAGLFGLLLWLLRKLFPQEEVADIRDVLKRERLGS
jgi:exosortase